MMNATSIVTARSTLLWGSLASCVPVGNRHARRLPIAAQDAILPHLSIAYVLTYGTLTDC
jgi:hypothetical protein